MNQINNAQARLYAGGKVAENFGLSREKQNNNLSKINGDMKLSQLLRERKAMVFKLAKARFSGGDIDGILKLEREIEAEVSAMLASYGLSLTDIEFSPVCEKCGDTGKVSDGDCECFKKYMFEYITARLSAAGGDVDFQASKLFAKSQPKLAKCYQYAEEFCNRYPQVSKKVMVFQGEVGTGKSHLSKGIVGRLVAKGFSGLFVSAFNAEELFVRHMQNATSFKQDQTVKDEYSLMQSVDVLTIDDIGAEIIHTPKVLPYYVNLLETRIAENKLTIFTTNLTERAIATKYGERFFSRLTSKATVVMKLETAADLRGV